MNRQSNCARVRALATASVIALGCAIAAPAAAQNRDDESERIVVTGSRIQRQDFTANSPIVTIDEEAFENTGSVGIESVLNQLPQFVDAQTQFTSFEVQGNTFTTPGASTVNLRGLGTGRNLVLVNGRRVTPINGSMAVDTNSIPAAAVQRVEVISGGASAVYGADAIAGVVNFILKDNFEGLTVDANYQITELGDGKEFRLSALYGANTPDGRGNALFGLEHSTRGTADAYERDWRIDELRNPNVAGSDFFWTDTYYAPSSTFPGNTAVTTVFPGTPPCDFDPAAAGCRDSASVSNLASFYLNRSDGSIYTTQPAGVSKYKGALDVDGFPFRKVLADGSLAQNTPESYVSLPLTRYSGFGRGRYSLTDSIDVVADGSFARTKTTTLLQYSPAVSQWAATIPVGSEIYGPSIQDGFDFTTFTPIPAILGYNPVTGDPIYNPNAPTNPAYVAGGALGLSCPALGGCTESQAFPLPPELMTLLAGREQVVNVAPPGAPANFVRFPSDPNEDIALNRVLDFLPQRQTQNQTFQFEMSLGLEGTLWNDWSWDASVTHGQSEATTQYIGFASLERYRAIAQSPNFGRGAYIRGNEEQGNQSGGTGSCTSGLPLVEDFEVSQDCIDAISAPMQQIGQFDQTDVVANITGDVFELPAGTLQFALGAEYREDNYSFKQDGLQSVQSFEDQVIGLFPLSDTHGHVDVREVYGELLVPLLSDFPAVQQLNLELGGRYSDYDLSGGVSTYKSLLDWLVLDWLRVRGGYNKATRAPNINELFLGRTQLVDFGAVNLYGDVCNPYNYQSYLTAATNPTSLFDPTVTLPDGWSAAQAAQTQKICRELMGGGATADNFYNPANALNVFSSGLGQTFYTGSRDVEPETADTWTAGLVVTSPVQNAWLRGFSGSLDYFQITLDDVIARESTDAVQFKCFDLQQNPTGSAQTEACQRLVRNQLTGAGASVDVGYTNEGHAVFSGVDLQVNWNTQFADLGLGFIPGGGGVNVLASFPIENITQDTPASPKRDWTGYQGCALGMSCSTYDYTLFTTFNYYVGPWNMSLRWQRQPAIDSAALLTNPNSGANGVLKASDIFDLTGGFRVSEAVFLRAGVQNLFNEPPALSGGSPAGEGVFPLPYDSAPTRSSFTGDVLGRRYYVGLNATF